MPTIVPSMANGGRKVCPPLALEIAKKAAYIRASLQKQGLSIGAYDVQIAAVALVEKMTLLTNNTREFERVEDLLLENWVD